jgi:hypothetical protein
VFTKLREYQFFLKRTKCDFGKTELTYLGHIISQKGVAADPSKTEVMSRWPTPTSVTKVRSFLGLTGYYRRFVKNYGVIAKPLTKLLQHKSFVWDTTTDMAFQALNEAMVTTPVLALPQFKEPFEVETDACATGIGAVLMQHHKPIAYLSKSLSSKNQLLSIYEKEFLALLLAVTKWRQYLQHTEFIIRTDHKALSFLEDQVLHSEWQQKAMTKLMGLQFRVVYREGKENVAADALSRVGHAMVMHSVTEVQPVWLQDVLNSYITDMEAQDLLAQLAVHSPSDQGFSLQNGLIRKDGLIWIANNSALRTKLISALHDGAVGGHSGSLATYHRIRRLFWWKGLKADMVEYVKQCDICQRAKAERIYSPGLLQPLPIPQGAWQDLAMDFIEGLPKSEGYGTILVVVDRYTKYAHFFSLKHPFSASMVAKVFLDNVVRLHGTPRSVVSDRDKIFTSHFWKSLFQALNTKLALTTAYHPQSDGQSERVNQCLEMYLRCAISDSPKQWITWLPLAEFWYNS